MTWRMAALLGALARPHAFAAIERLRPAARSNRRICRPRKPDDLGAILREDEAAGDRPIERHGKLGEVFALATGVEPRERRCVERARRPEQEPEDAAGLAQA